MTPQISEAIDSYRPRVVTDEVWDTAGPIVRRRVRATGPTSLSMARRLLSAAAGMVVWALGDHVPAVEQTLFSTETVERYVAILTEKDARDHATIRSRLRRLTKAGSTAPAPASYAHRSVKPPYTTEEIAGLLATAKNQPTSLRSRRLVGVIALGAGCGLSAGDMRTVKGTDVTRAASGAVQVEVGGSKARRVVCLATYEDDLLAVAAAAGDRLIVVGDGSESARGLVCTLTETMVGDLSGRLSAARLRSTWLTTMLSARVPLAWIMAAAGLSTARTLADLLPYAASVDQNQFDEALRFACGPDSAADGGQR